MKKYAPLLIALLAVLTILVACTTGGNEATTPTDTTVNDPATGDVTDPATGDATDPSTGDATDPGTDATTDVPTQEIVQPEQPMDGFAMDHERIERQLSGASGLKATRVELDGNYVLKLSSTGASADPQVYFNVKNYCTA